ncbi:Uncharacterised protein [Mycobacteroides abscessus]|nr:Uncharacterised protein [Mycobacteroides abscessus]
MGGACAVNSVGHTESLDVGAWPGLRKWLGGSSRWVPPHLTAQWNWPSSVEPFSAAVEVFGSTVVAILSK